MKEIKNKLIGSGAILSSLLSSICWVGPLIIMSLGLSGIGLSYISFLIPYQVYFKGFAIISLLITHYRLANHPVNKKTETFIWVVTVIVFMSLLSPIVLRFLI